MQVVHTIGPWVLDAPEHAQHIIQDYHFIDAGKGYHCERSGNGFGIAGFMSQADAQLIAAAPDLLHAVQRGRQKLATYVSVYPGDKELRFLLATWDAAIAKTTGVATC